MVGDGDGPIATNTILTREADKQIAHIHPGMPLILKGEELDPWMKGEIGTHEAADTFGTGHNFAYHEVQKFGFARTKTVIAGETATHDDKSHG